MITKPTLLLDEKKCRDNIRRMAEKTKKNQVAFRPHFKTHQSLEIGRWFKEPGVDKITVSSLDMAVYFASEWNDITVAFPVNILEIETINYLAGRINLNLLIESDETASCLKAQLTSRVGFFIKIDVGTHRTGVDPLDKQKIDRILAVSVSGDFLSFKGFLGHAGHTYKCRTRQDVLEVQNDSIKVMNQLRNNYIKAYPDLVISMGDTPGCSVADDFSGVDELRPGNFVFYDLTQNRISSNSIEQIAVALACPIVAIHQDRREIIVYGGGVHFSKERMENEEEGIVYGRVVEKTDRGWGNIIQGMYLKALSQEHGIVSVPDSRITDYSIGDYLLILPVHSCMTANLMKSYLTLDKRKISRL